MSEVYRSLHPERYQRLIGLSSDLASSQDLNQVLTHIADAAAELCSAQAASILLYDESSNQLYFEAATNLESPLLRGLNVPLDSIAGWIVKHRQPVLISDVQNDARYFSHVEDTTHVKTRSMLGVPLVSRERVVGALEVINKLDGVFNEEDQELLVALGAQAAIVMENARLSQQADLISELVHELRTPLGSLAAVAHLLSRPNLDKDEQINLAQTMQREINRLADMATSFLDLARLESGRSQFKIEEVDLARLLRDTAEVVESRAAERKLMLLLGLPESLPGIHGDQAKLKQVAMNLLNNAIKFTPDGGSITLSAWANEQEVAYAVEDTGPGIAASDLPHIFDKFYRVAGTSEAIPGTGRGLSICQHIVEAHQGWTEVSSQEGQGTTFTVHLPIFKGPAAA